jgi:hypothetical protein
MTINNAVRIILVPVATRLDTVTSLTFVRSILAATADITVLHR